MQMPPIPLSPSLLGIPTSKYFPFKEKLHVAQVSHHKAFGKSESEFTPRLIGW